jgi:hypothetical protein
VRDLQGIVFKGAGVAGNCLKPLLPAIRHRTGLTNLLPHTLNIRLPVAYTGTRDFIFEAKAHSHHEDVYLERCRVRGLDALIMRTSTNHHGASVLEIMAEVFLKQHFGITDGDVVTIQVYTRATADSGVPGGAYAPWSILPSTELAYEGHYALKFHMENYTACGCCPAVRSTSHVSTSPGGFTTPVA